MTAAQTHRQADAFRGWYRKVGGDLEQTFAVWCESKDLAQQDRDRIWLALHGRLEDWAA